METMIQHQAFKYRLKTKPADKLLMMQFAGCCRFVWNKALAFQKERLDAGEMPELQQSGTFAAILGKRTPDPE